MPNHVTNVVKPRTVSAIELADIEAAFTNEDGEVDFEKIIPMPELLKLPEGETGTSMKDLDIARVMSGVGIENQFGFLSEKDVTTRTNEYRQEYINMPEDDRAAIDRLISAYEATGHFYWYSWSIDHWGTKWNAYDTVGDDPEEYRFDTAWSHPGPIIYSLSKLFPHVPFDIAWADEDLGCNCGYYTILNGVISGFEQSECSSQEQDDATQARWNKFAAGLKYGVSDPQEMGYNEHWLYEPDDEEE